MLLKDYIPNVNKKYKRIFFSGVTFDSSKVKKDNIFFAIKGNKFDGNNYIDLAIQKGSKIVVTIVFTPFNCKKDIIFFYFRTVKSDT